MRDCWLWNLAHIWSETGRVIWQFMSTDHANYGISQMCMTRCHSSGWNDSSLCRVWSIWLGEIKSQVEDKNTKMFLHEANCFPVVINQHVEWKHSTFRRNEMRFFFSTLLFCFLFFFLDWAGYVCSSTWSCCFNIIISFSKPILKYNKYIQMRDTLIRVSVGNIHWGAPGWRRPAGSLEGRAEENGLNS